MPTAAHVIYIPAMLMFGIVIGYMLGTRAARDALQAEQTRLQAKAAGALPAKPGPGGRGSGIGEGNHAQDSAQ